MDELDQMARLPDLGATVRLYTESNQTPKAAPVKPKRTRDLVNYKPRRGELPWTFGYEMTALIGDYEETDNYGSSCKSDDRTQEISIKIGNATLHRMNPEKYKRGEYYFDNHCMEFPSPVFTTRDKALKFYRRMKRQFDKYGCTAQNPQTVCGGNHMHFGISNWTDLLRIYRDFFRRPEITWVFTQPDDLDSCNGLLGDAKMNAVESAVQASIIRVDGAEYPEYRGTRNPLAIDALSFYQYKILRTNDTIQRSQWKALASKDHGLSIMERDGAIVLECRGIEAPNDESEFIDQMDFFFAYLKWAIQYGDGSRYREFKTPAQYQAIRKSDAERNFYSLCGMLGLNPGRYEKYVKRNLRPRWSKVIPRKRS